MNLQENIRRILREDKKTKSTNKEFSKYKDSKFNSLRDYTLQDIVDDWDSLSDHKNENPDNSVKSIRPYKLLIYYMRLLLFHFTPFTLARCRVF